MSGIGNLEEEAKKRKQRLLALRAKKEGKTVEQLTQEPEENGESGETVLPKPIFRSYKPAHDSLKENVMDGPKPIDVADRVTSQIEAGKPEPIIEEVDIAALAPRKPDWDLKRDVAKKLEKLDKRTQRAIAELIRERLQQEKSKDGEALARAVTRANQEQEVDEEED